MHFSRKNMHTISLIQWKHGLVGPEGMCPTTSRRSSSSLLPLIDYVYVIPLFWYPTTDYDILLLYLWPPSVWWPNWYGLSLWGGDRSQVRGVYSLKQSEYIHPCTLLTILHMSRSCTGCMPFTGKRPVTSLTGMLAAYDPEWNRWMKVSRFVNTAYRSYI